MGRGNEGHHRHRKPGIWIWPSLRDGGGGVGAQLSAAAGRSTPGTGSAAGASSAFGSSDTAHRANSAVGASSGSAACPAARLPALFLPGADRDASFERCPDGN